MPGARWRREGARRRCSRQGSRRRPRRDAGAAAAKVAKRVELETPDAAARFAALQAALREWYERGCDRGLDLDLAVAVEIAKLALGRAAGPDERGAALNNLGLALRFLGQRESGTARLGEAVAVLRAALEEFTRERVPLDWARTQHNLGLALWTLGERESGTARLEEAVAAHRAALEECTRERVPLDWAIITGNQGVAQMTLAERRGDSAMAAQAAAHIETARDAVQEGGHGPFADHYEGQLPKALALRDRLAGGRRPLKTPASPPTRPSHTP